MGEIEARNLTSSPPLTVEDVARRVAEITSAVHDQHDHEKAHDLDDKLRADVLAAIAAGAPDAQILATAALRSDTLDFYRW